MKPKRRRSRVIELNDRALAAELSIPLSVVRELAHSGKIPTSSIRKRGQVTERFFRLEKVQYALRGEAMRQAGILPRRSQGGGHAAAKTKTTHSFQQSKGASQ